ncbi:MAG: hypothetical protein M0R80_08750 [Proteobacteria bacterium]|nr:hypothetical protein [Pseudomonadota bacterium]
MSSCPINVNPHAQASLVNTPTMISLNYTNQDFWSLKTRLRDFIKERFGPSGSVLPNTFNDLVESSIAIMLMENFAFVGDMLSFKQDQIVNEMFIDTVTEVENAFRMSKLIGFEPQPPIAASSMWSATINSTTSTDILIPTPVPIDIVSGGTATTIELFQADENNEPLLDEDIIIPAGELINTSIIGLEGKTYNDLFSGTGQVSQTLTLLQSPVIYDSVRVYVDGVLWDKVDYFTDSQPRREYRLEFDSAWVAYVIFGNNKAGLLPPQNSRIQVIYRVGGGTVGNIVSGYVTFQYQADISGADYRAPVIFNNYTQGRYGYNGDTIEDVRKKLPLWVKTQDRAVSGADYKILSEQLSTAYHGQISKANVTLRNYGCAGNIIDIYALALGSLNTTNGITTDLETASNNLKMDLITELNDKKMLTDFICIKDGIVLRTDVAIEITLDKFYRKFQEEIKNRILEQTGLFFSLSNWDYGQTLRSVDLIKQLAIINEANTFTISFTTDDPSNSGEIVSALYYQIIRPDDISIRFIYS